MTYSPPPNPVGGLRLHLNENTAGCSPAVLEAVRGITPEDISAYPDYGRVTAACERWFGVAPGWVLLTNGLDEGLHITAQAASLRAGGQTPSAVFAEPAFEMYAASAEAAGLVVRRVDPGPNLEFPIDAVLGAIGEDTRLVLLTDPNNPTGLALPEEAAARVVAAAPDAIVLLDEAYAEFSGRTAIGSLLGGHRNLVIGRTFAKAYGLAALRVGALVAHPDTLAPLRRILPPFSVNVCAVRALEAALGDRSHLDWYVAQAAESRQLVSDFCRRHGFETWPSEGNFALVRTGADAAAVVDALASRGVLVRDRSASPGCAGCVRVTAGVVGHTRACLAAWEEILASRTG
jgi:histidinol-phosphate aminotransferase